MRMLVLDNPIVDLTNDLRKNRCYADSTKVEASLQI